MNTFLSGNSDDFPGRLLPQLIGVFTDGPDAVGDTENGSALILADIRHKLMPHIPQHIFGHFI